MAAAQRGAERLKIPNLGNLNMSRASGESM